MRGSGETCAFASADGRAPHHRHQSRVSSRPHPLSPQPRGGADVADRMLRRSSRLALAVEMTEMPSRPRFDQTTDDPAVDQLRKPTSSTTPATNNTRGNERHPPTPSTPMRLVRISPPVDIRPHQRLAPRTAIPLICRDRHELPPAHIATTKPVGERHPTPQPHRPTRLAPGTQRLISVSCEERLRTGATRLQHGESGVFLGDNPGERKVQCGGGH